MFKLDITPYYSAHIRVNRGLYYHHGIYIDNQNVVQFGSVTGELDPKTAKVMITDLETFLKNGSLEVREYSAEEEKVKRSPQEIVNIALSMLGTGGYDILTNNCEHFANYCVFGEKRSEQVDKISDILKSFFYN